jgi:AmmeMemoRadiSam system protein A
MNADDEFPTPLGADTRSWLLDLARRTIDAALAGEPTERPDPATIPSDAAGPGAAFVTLRRNGRLLGCIGSMVPTRSLAEDVAAHAYDAAFRDPRLPAITRRDAARMVVEISVLGPLQPVDAHSAEELLAALRPGVDGVLVSSRDGRATFLPAVWHQVLDGTEFLELLWRKAGFAPGSWPADLEVERYQVVEFDDAPPG